MMAIVTKDKLHHSHCIVVTFPVLLKFQYGFARIFVIGEVRCWDGHLILDWQSPFFAYYEKLLAGRVVDVGTVFVNCMNPIVASRRHVALEVDDIDRFREEASLLETIVFLRCMCLSCYW